jgi:hypothetical protein
MRKLIFTLLLTTGTALAEDFTVSHIGQFDFCHGSCGTNYTVTHVGNFDFINDSRGDDRPINGTVSHIGRFDYFTNFSGRECGE